MCLGSTNRLGRFYFAEVFVAKGGDLNTTGKMYSSATNVFIGAVEALVDGATIPSRFFKLAACMKVTPMLQGFYGGVHCPRLKPLAKH